MKRKRLVLWRVVPLAVAATLAMPVMAPIFAQSPDAAIDIPGPPGAGPGQKAGLQFIPQVGIPGSGPEAKPFTEAYRETPAGPELLGKYIATIYRFGLWLAIFLAIVMTMVGGFLWLIAGGSSERVSSAKGYIGGALTGLVVALTSFLILQTVNPRLVELSIPVPTIVPPAAELKARVSATGCAVKLTVDNVSKCEEACKQAGREGAYIPPGSSQAVAPLIPDTNPRLWCCACRKGPNGEDFFCKEEGKSCSVGAQASLCCPPLRCNQAVFSGTCLYKRLGTEQYSVSATCAVDADCLSNLCLSFVDESYCVPVGGFTTADHRCKRDEECKTRLCLDGYCRNKLPTGGYCRSNRECLSGRCDTAELKCW